VYSTEHKPSHQQTSFTLTYSNICNIPPFVAYFLICNYTFTKKNTAITLSIQFNTVQIFITQNTQKTQIRQNNAQEGDFLTHSVHITTHVKSSTLSSLPYCCSIMQTKNGGLLSRI